MVDRNGDPVAILRDVFAPRIMIEIAMRTANTVVMSGVDSGEFVRNAKDLAEKLDHIGITLSEAGAVRIEAADGSFLGAASVSGAPTGEDDERCVRKALKAVEERLMFDDM
nr:heme-binding protein [Thiobacillus sp.]